MNNFNELFLQAFNDFSEGNIESALENLDKAERIFSPFEENQFNLENLYILRGSIYFSQNRFESARENFEKALQENPNSSEACLGLGKYFHAVELDENAKIMFEWAVKYDNNNEGAAKALDAINEVISLKARSNSGTKNSAGSTAEQEPNILEQASDLFLEKKYDLALEKLLIAKKGYEINMSSLENFIAFNLLGLKRYKEAGEAAARALKLNPESSQAHAVIGEIYLQNKDYKLAESEYNLALKKQPDNEFAKKGLEKVHNAIKNNSDQNTYEKIGKAMLDI